MNHQIKQQINQNDNTQHKENSTVNYLNSSINQKKEELFSSGYSCSQSILMLWAEDLGIKRKDAFRISAGFGGGMAFGEVCGAVAGAVMVIGLKFSSANADTKEGYAKALTYELTSQFLSQFKSTTGSVSCRDLIGFDFSTLEKNQDILDQDRNLHKNCPNFVRTAASILENIINSYEDENA